MIHWSIDPEIFSFWFIHIRYYSLMFLISFVLGMVIMRRIFRQEGHPPTDVDDLLVYMMIGTVVGARLGHVIFYNPGFYFSNPIEILKVWEGGLASHGAAIGILLALYFFVRNKKGYSYLWLVDRIVIVVALAGCFIRLGNLFNSEIIGKPTDLPWAFIFTHVDNVPRHPTQIYESLAYLIIFFILLRLYNAHKSKLKPGYLLGLFLVLIFGFRFFVEFLKAPQEAFERSMFLDMGQILSIPLVIIGFYLIFTARNRPIPEAKTLTQNKPEKIDTKEKTSKKS